jgi:hypothetical protein
MERLAEGDSEQEDEQGEADSDPPSGQLPPATTAAALAAFDRRKRRHGA